MSHRGSNPGLSISKYEPQTKKNRRGISLSCSQTRQHVSNSTALDTANFPNLRICATLLLDSILVTDFDRAVVGALRAL